MGRAINRRSGSKAAIAAAMLALGAKAGDARAKSGDQRDSKRGGHCGDGSDKANRCSKDSQCCRGAVCTAGRCTTDAEAASPSPAPSETDTPADAAAPESGPEPAGPCGNGSVKQNRCKRNSDCCTDICEQNLDNKDKLGRCRCRSHEQSCSSTINCCRDLVCNSGFCVPSSGTGGTGPTGPAGPGIVIKGSVNSSADLPVTGNTGDAWIDQETGDLFTWNDGTQQWDDVGRIVGTTGPSGPTGLGAPMVLRQSVANANQLPASGDPGDGHIDESTGDVYTWDPVAEQWVNGGRIVGTTGPTGHTGAVGAPMVIQGSVASAAQLPGSGDPGDGYTDQSTGNIFTWDPSGSQWIDGGRIVGPTGPTGAIGAAGAPLVIQGSVADSGQLPATGDPGDGYIDQSTGKIYTWDPDTSQWVDGGRIVGPTGPTGPQGYQGLVGEAGPTGPEGPQGDAGPAMNIVGSVTGANSLPATGSASEGYYNEANGHLYTWDQANGQWIDVGQIQGPRGIQGVQGVQGPTGPTGVAGAASTVMGPTGPTGSGGATPMAPTGAIQYNRGGSFYGELPLRWTYSGEANRLYVSNSDGPSSATILALLGHASQTGPFIKNYNSTGTELMRIHSPNGTTVFIGNAAGASSTSAEAVGIGTNALQLSTASHNTAVGSYALASNTSGRGTAIGSRSLYSLTTGGGVAVGEYSMYSTTTGFGTALGYYAAYYNTTGDRFVAVGERALQNNTTGRMATAIGGSAMFSATTAWESVAVGYEALKSVTTNSNNTAVGSKSQSAVTGSNNTSVGYHSMLNTASGDYNTAVGSQAMDAATSGSKNVALGAGALYGGTGSNNIVLGADSGSTLSGSNNVLIGFNVEAQNTASSYQLNIGNAIYGTGLSSQYADPSPAKIGIGVKAPAETLHVGNEGNSGGNIRASSLAGTGNRAVYSDADGTLTNSSSDATMKTDVVPLGSGIATVTALNPVTFTWVDTSRLGAQREVGLLAQEVREVVPEVVGTNADGTLTVDYPKLVAPLIAAVKEQQAEITALRDRLARLEGGA